MGSQMRDPAKLEKPQRSHESKSDHRSHSKSKKAINSSTDKDTSEKKKKKKSPKDRRENELSRSHSEKCLRRMPDRRQLLAQNTLGKSATLSRRNLMDTIKPAGKADHSQRAGRPGMVKSESKKSLLAGAEILGKGLMILADDVLDLVLDDDTGKKKRERRKKEEEMKKRSLSPVPGQGLGKSGSRRNLLGGTGGSKRNLMGGSKRNLMGGDDDKKSTSRSGSKRDLMKGIGDQSDDKKPIKKNHGKEIKKKSDHASHSKERKKKSDNKKHGDEVNKTSHHSSPSTKKEVKKKSAVSSEDKDKMCKTTDGTKKSAKIKTATKAGRLKEIKKSEKPTNAEKRPKKH